MINKGTFGGSLAAKNLNHILIELNDKRYVKLVAKFINQMDYVTQNLKDIKSDQFYMGTLKIYAERIQDSVNNTELPPIVKSHLNNHLSTLKKEAMRARKEEIDYAEEVEGDLYNMQNGIGGI